MAAVTSRMHWMAEGSFLGGKRDSQPLLWVSTESICLMSGHEDQHDALDLVELNYTSPPLPAVLPDPAMFLPASPLPEWHPLLPPIPIHISVTGGSDKLLGSEMQAQCCSLSSVASHWASSGTGPMCLMAYLQQCTNDDSAHDAKDWALIEG